MDVTRLSETLGWMRADEANFKIQEKLVAVQTALQSLSGNPAEQSYQVQLNKSMKDLSLAVTKFESNYDPARMGRIDQIGGTPYFTQNLSNSISDEISKNPMTPAAALSVINELIIDRQNFIAKVVATEVGVDTFVEYGSSLGAGQTEIGFEIPREIFHNDFKDFINELRAILRIVRVFSEVGNGTVPEIKLGNISSTDPLVFLNAPPVVVGSIAMTVSWLLTQWKKLEEIRKLRAESAKLEIFDKKEIESIFDSKIKQSLDEAVANKVADLLNNSVISTERKNEIDSELGWAIKSLFARVERGMRIEVNVALLPTEEDQKMSDSEESLQETLKSVEIIGSELSFPSAREEAILALPQLPDKELDSHLPTKAKPQSRRRALNLKP